MSDEIAIADTVLQGTVLGPPLWNTYFSDVTKVATDFEARPAAFADDLNIFKESDMHHDDDASMRWMQVCR